MTRFAHKLGALQQQEFICKDSHADHQDFNRQIRHYLLGEKRCKKCCLYIKNSWRWHYCPVCGHKLSTKPKTCDKERFRELLLKVGSRV